MNCNLRKILCYPIDTPIKFWLKYWEYRVKELSDLDNFDIQLNNPHFLLEEIVSEIEYNNFKNPDNRKLFKNLLGNLDKHDKVFSDLYAAEKVVIFNNWDNSPLVVKKICIKILHSMGNFDYLNAISKKLQIILDADRNLTEENKNKICLYSDLFIQELICLGVDVNDIANFINEDELVVREDGKVVICGDTFYELKRADYQSEEEYYNAVTLRCETRSAEEYINNLLTHFYKKPKIGYVLLRLLGAKGSIDCHLKDLHLYSIDKATYLPKNSLSKIEYNDGTFQFVNIAVKVEHRFFYTSLGYAKQKVNSLLDYLSFYVKGKGELSISGQFAAIVVDGHECAHSVSMEDDVKCLHLYRDLRSLDFSSINDSLNEWLKDFTNDTNIDSENFKRISNSTHWYKKAIGADRYEDKLLYSWIALESILKISDSVKMNIISKDNSIFNLAKTICSIIVTKNRFNSYAENVYRYLMDCTQNYDNYYDLKLETIENAKLSSEGMLPNFFRELPEIISEMNDEIYKLELLKLKSFYENDKGIKNFRAMVCNDITLIYRLRNMIVHNAFFPEFQIKLYAYKAQFITGSLIHAIRFYYSKYGTNIDDALLDIYSEYQVFESNVLTYLNKLKGKCHD